MLDQKETVNTSEFAFKLFEYGHLLPNNAQWESNGSSYARVLNVPNEFVNNCFICNRPLDDRKGSWVHLSTDGGLFAIAEYAANTDATSQGWFPVGSACASKLPAAYVTKRLGA
jgi:hypothetical protein